MFISDDLLCNIVYREQQTSDVVNKEVQEKKVEETEEA